MAVRIDATEKDAALAVEFYKIFNIIPVGADFKSHSDYINIRPLRARRGMEIFLCKNVSHLLVDFYRHAYHVFLSI